MKQIIRDYLTFNKRERNGVFVLLTIIILLIVYLNVSDKFLKAPTVDFSKFEKQMDSLNTSQKEEPEFTQNSSLKKYASHESAANTVTQKAERFNFNPNNLPDNDWKRLGLSDKQIKTIKNYESKGGSFRKKEDVKKMYCIKEELYNSLEPYIQIPQENKPAAAFVDSKVVVLKSAAPVVIIELNAADSAQLTTLKGIGAFFAKTIIKYRNSLGGFYAKEQLLEVWKFDPEKYAMIEKFVSVDAASIKKININDCEAAQLKNPYLNWNMANAIVNYRKAHGKFKTIDDIKKTDLVDDETLRKIAPYLILE